MVASAVALLQIHAFGYGSADPQSPAGVASSAATKPHDASYVIGTSDVLAITVWKEPEVSRSIPVRPDGRISLALVGEIQAAGRTPMQLEEEIAVLRAVDPRLEIQPVDLVVDEDLRNVARANLIQHRVNRGGLLGPPHGARRLSHRDDVLPLPGLAHGHQRAVPRGAGERARAPAHRSDVRRAGLP